MNKLIVKDGTEIYYKDLGQGQPHFLPPRMAIII